jgi:type III secretion protein U
VAAASVVVVNPTHFAVAIRYQAGECEAPYLVAKGKDERALELRAQAAALRIPVVKNISFARSAYAYEVGEAIPEELYRAAAAVLTAAWEQQIREDIT